MGWERELPKFRWPIAASLPPRRSGPGVDGQDALGITTREWTLVVEKGTLLPPRGRNYYSMQFELYATTL